MNVVPWTVGLFTIVPIILRELALHVHFNQHGDTTKLNCHKFKMGTLGLAAVTPRPTDSTREFENLSDEAEKLFYSSLFRVYVTSIWS